MLKQTAAAAEEEAGLGRWPTQQLLQEVCGCVLKDYRHFITSVWVLVVCNPGQLDTPPLTIPPSLHPSILASCFPSKSRQHTQVTTPDPRPPTTPHCSHLQFPLCASKTFHRLAGEKLFLGPDDLNRFNVSSSSNGGNQAAIFHASGEEPLVVPKP